MKEGWCKMNIIILICFIHVGGVQIVGWRDLHNILLYQKTRYVEELGQ